MWRRGAVSVLGLHHGLQPDDVGQAELRPVDLDAQSGGAEPLCNSGKGEGDGGETPPLGTISTPPWNRSVLPESDTALPGPGGSTPCVELLGTLQHPRQGARAAADLHQLPY